MKIIDMKTEAKESLVETNRRLEYIQDWTEALFDLNDDQLSNDTVARAVEKLYDVMGEVEDAIAYVQRMG